MNGPISAQVTQKDISKDDLSVRPRRVTPDDALISRIHKGEIPDRQLYQHAKQTRNEKLSIAAIQMLSRGSSAENDTLIKRLVAELQKVPKKLSRLLDLITNRKNCGDALFEVSQKTDNPDIRFRSARYLLEAKDPRGVHVAHQFLSANEKQYPYERCVLKQALIKHGDTTFLAEVVKRIEDPREWTRADLLRACAYSPINLSKYRYLFEAISKDKNESLSKYALMCLASISPSEALFSKITSRIKETSELEMLVDGVSRKPTLAGIRWVNMLATDGNIAWHDDDFKIKCLDTLLNLSKAFVSPADICKTFVMPTPDCRRHLAILSQQRPGALGLYLTVLGQAERYPSLSGIARPKKDMFIEALKLGIRSPYRYDDSLLKEIVSNRTNPNIDSRPLAVVVMPRSDWNGAFRCKEGGVLDQIRRAGYKLMVYEASTDKEFALNVLDATKKKKFTLMVIGGHGSQTTLSFSEKEPRFSNRMNLDKTFDIHDADKLKKYDLNSPAVNGKAQAILWSCSAGQGKDKEQNTANTVAKIFPGLADIFAPVVPTNIKGVTFTADMRVASVTFTRASDMYVKKVSRR